MVIFHMIHSVPEEVRYGYRVSVRLIVLYILFQSIASRSRDAVVWEPDIFSGEGGGGGEKGEKVWRLFRHFCVLLEYQSISLPQ